MGSECGTESETGREVKTIFAAIQYLEIIDLSNIHFLRNKKVEKNVKL